MACLGKIRNEHFPRVRIVFPAMGRLGAIFVEGAVFATVVVDKNPIPAGPQI